jgi:PAS domain S-box-containing protein
MFENDASLKVQLEERTLALRSCEARFRNIITRSADGVVVVDGSGCIRFINPAAASLFGRTAEDLLGKPFGFPVVAGETTELDIGAGGKQGAVVEMRVVETEWGESSASLATLRDITKRRRNEQEFRKMYRAVLESPDIVMISDPRGAIEFVNHKFTAVTGYSFAEAVGQNPRFLKSGKVPPEVYKELWETILPDPADRTATGGRSRYRPGGRGR